MALRLNLVKIGGDDIIIAGWTSGTNERVRAMTTYNGELYVGVGELPVMVSMALEWIDLVTDRR